MNVRASRLVATAFVLISVPLLAACGGSDEVGANASGSPSASSSVSGSASPGADDQAGSRTNAPAGERPSVEKIYEAILTTGNFDDRKAAAKCVAEAFHDSKLSDAFLEMAVDPTVKYDPTEAEVKQQGELLGKAATDCGLETSTPSPSTD